MSWGIFRIGSDNFRTEYGDITESTRFRIDSGILLRTQSKRISESILDISGFTTEPFALEKIQHMTSTFHLPPTVLARVFSPQECREMIDFAETQMWNVEKDSVDDQPAWELEVLTTNAGRVAATRLHQRIVLLRPEIKIQKHAIH